MAGTVLVVDDEQMLREMYAAWLQEEHEVRTAEDGETALDQVDDDVDVVLLDRRMPGIRGDEVLMTIREQDLDCRVVMVSAVDPDTDVVSLPFDDYLVKPGEVDDVSEAVEVAMEREKYDPRVREYLSVVAKLGLLEHHSPSVPMADEGLEPLRERMHELRAELEEEVDWLDDPEVYEELVMYPPRASIDDPTGEP